MRSASASLPVLIMVSMLIGCKQSVVETELFVFGTLVELRIEGLDQAPAALLLATIESDFQRLHRDWHAWRPGQLDTLNSVLRNGGRQQVDHDLAALLRRARELEQLSLGTFNPAIGNLIREWGFHTSDYPVTGPPPTDQVIASWIQQSPSMNDLVFVDQQTILGDGNSAVRIDLGGIAKGAAVDRAIALIRDAGAQSAIVNAGGDLRAFGRASQPWRIAIRHPTSGDVLGGIEVAGDEAIFTSGNYTRYRAHEQKRYAHIIDPRSGLPVEHIASATVIASDGTLADAAATALVVAGPAQWREVATRMGIERALLVDDSGCLLMTPAMRTRLELLTTDCDERIKTP